MERRATHITVPRRREPEVRLPDLPGAASAVERDWEACRERVAELPSDTEGIDLDRANAFLTELGMPIPDAVFCSEDDMVRYAKSFTSRSDRAKMIVAKAVMWLLEVPQADTAGFAHGGPDYLVIARSRSAKSTNDAEVMESMYLHEAAHLSSTHGHIRYHRKRGKIRGDLARNGLALRSSHRHAKDFLEEAFVEMVRGQYVSTVLGRPGGFAHETATMVPFLSDWRFGEIAVPAKYSLSDSEGNTGSTAYAPAAYALELLVAAQPALYDALMESRTSVHGLRDVAKLIEAVEPGLYPKLRRQRANEPAMGLLMVQRALGIEQGRGAGGKRREPQTEKSK